MQGTDTALFRERIIYAFLQATMVIGIFLVYLSFLASLPERYVLLFCWLTIATVLLVPARYLVHGAYLIFTVMVVLAVNDIRHVGAAGLHRELMITGIFILTVMVGRAGLQFALTACILLLIGFGLLPALLSETVPINAIFWSWGREIAIITCLATGLSLSIQYVLERLANSEKLAGVLSSDLHREVSANAEMREKRKELEKQLEHNQRIEQLGQLAGGVAHDFNNILVAIMGHAEIARHKETSAENRAHLDAIIRSSEKASKLTGQLLSFSRRQSSALEALNFVDLVKNIEQMLLRLIPSNISLHLDIPQEELIVHGDRTQLEQVIVNLAVNARDAMPAGGRLELIVRRDEDPERQSDTYIQLIVRDSGLGIPPDATEKIFEPYYTTKPEGQGTGLGLSMVRSIASAHDGYIEVAPRHEGTDFVLSLPQGKRAVTEASADDVFEGSMQGTILLLEDDREVRDVTRSLLTQAGLDVIVSNSGPAGLHTFTARAAEIDLIITDYMMPDMGGAEFALAVRQQSTRVGIIITSGYPLDETSISGLGADFLKKPYDRSRLLDVVSATLRQRSGHSASA